jgi:hypothetical protein
MTVIEIEHVIDLPGDRIEGAAADPAGAPVVLTCRSPESAFSVSIPGLLQFPKATIPD